MNIINFSYRFAARDPLYDVYPGKPRREGGLPWEGYEKARWLHHVSGVPVTWIVDSVAIDQAYRRMRNDVETTGDELILQLEPFAHQPLLEKLGIKQEPFGLRNYKTGDLVTLFKGLKKFAEDKLELPVTIGSGYWLSAQVIRAAAEAGFEAIWGMCWDQKGIDGATHRGSPWFPYYLSEEDFKAPSTKPGGVLFFPWYRADLGNAFLLNHHPPFTTHSGELVRWNLDFPETYVRAMFAQAAHEARTSPFAFSQVHLECDWMDSSGIFHDEDTSPAAVTFEFQKKMVQLAASMEGYEFSTLARFVAWHRKNFEFTTRHDTVWTDPFENFPPLRFAADCDSLRVSTIDGELLASQNYRDGKLAEADAGFLDRYALGRRLCPNPRLPFALQWRLRQWAAIPDRQEEGPRIDTGAPAPMGSGSLI